MKNWSCATCITYPLFPRSNIAGTAPRYDDNGKLLPMAHETETFLHPHDLVVDAEHSLYVAQFASGKTYPIKLERV